MKETMTMTTLISSPSDEHAHAVEIAGGPEPVRSALTSSLTHLFGYSSVEKSACPVIHLVIDARDERPDEVVKRYVRRALEEGSRPIPLFLTARAKKFRRRGLAWESEFLFPAGKVPLDQLVAQMRMLAFMWGNDFPIDIVRDAVVGSFRMMMKLDADDYHHRSELVEDLQRIAEWDAHGTPPALRAAQHGSWQPRLSESDEYARLFATAYREINVDMRLMLDLRDQTHDPTSPNRMRDLANTILRKIPAVNGRFVHALRDTRPHVLIIDDEADRIVTALKKQRIGYERDSAVLDDVFRFGAEPLTLENKPALPPHFDAETWIRRSLNGELKPAGTLIDLRCADLLLLDLSLDQGPDSELGGFVLLEKLRKIVPDIPVVIHTGSAELGHIIQAIRNGADWYVRKDAARAYSDLASILNDIGHRPEWHKSAVRLGKERTITDIEDLKPELKNEKFHYVWRALALDLPKGELRVTHFSTGVSGAVTCGIDVLPPRKKETEATERYPLTSFVAKIDRPYVIVSERERFRSLVAPRIGNRAGRIDSDVVHAGPNVAGIAYTFSGIQQGQKKSNRTSLLPLFNFLDRVLDSSNARFADVTPLFEELLHGLLPALHSTSDEPRGEWINPLFGETRSLRDSHELRLPPLIDIEVSAFSDAQLDHRPAEIPTSVGKGIHLPVCRIQKASEHEISVLFTDDHTGRTHRANLTGEIARFLAEFRNLRPNRAFSITGKIVRKREMYYDDVARELAEDLDWLRENRFADPFTQIGAALRVFEQLDGEVVGIVHGDLNLDNILVDVDQNDLPVRGALWLIDFARTRRDSLAHDFVEMEVDLVTRLLAKSCGVLPTAAIMEFFHSLDAGPLYARQQFDTVTSFVNEACHFIRRAAAMAKVSKNEYLATLVIYYLIVLKLNYPLRRIQGEGNEAIQIRRWSLVGAAAALHALGIGANIPADHEARLHLDRAIQESAVLGPRLPLRASESADTYS